MINLENTLVNYSLIMTADEDKQHDHQFKFIVNNRKYHGDVRSGSLDFLKTIN